MVQAVSPCLAKYTTEHASLMTGSRPPQAARRPPLYASRGRDVRASRPPPTVSSANAPPVGLNRLRLPCSRLIWSEGNRRAQRGGPDHRVATAGAQARSEGAAAH